MRRASIVILLFFTAGVTPLVARTVTPTGGVPPAFVTCPTGLTAGGASGTYTVTLTSASPAGQVATPDSSNTAVARVPAPFTIPTGATTFTFQVTPVAAGNADVGVTVNGLRRDCSLTVGAAVAPAGPAGSPTLSTAGLLMMAILLATAGVVVARRL